MWRTLRAFAWLRWRVLINSLERRGSRDVIERFSAAFEQLAPAITALVMLPSAVALAGAAAFAGWTVGRGEGGVVFDIVRFALLAACGLTVVGPILLPGSERTNTVRLLLLPIPRRVLYLAQSISALTDPWVLLAATIVLALPVGIASAGNLPAAAVGLVAGVLFLVILVGVTQLVTSTVHLIVRDRRRAELMTLVLVVFLPLVGMLPGLLGSGRHRARQIAIEREHEPSEPRWWSGLERKAFSALPSEVYARSVDAAAENVPAGLGSLVALAAAGGIVHVVALLAFGRVLSSPGTVGGSRTVTTEARPGWRIPGASPAVSAVALNQLRLALRTPRGRATLLSPIVVFGLFAVMMVRGRSGMDVGPLQVDSGLNLASFVAFVSLLSILPLAMNQFAIDRAGFTLAMLVPLETAALLRGKAIGNALITSIPAGICLAGAAIFFPSGDPMMWLCIPLTLISAYLLVAPVAAMLSAIFPRAVDLNSIGRGSNAHGAAGLLGMLAFLAAAAPGLAIALVTSRGFGRPALAPVTLLLWTAVCFAVSFGLFRVADAIFDRRRENLGLTSARPPG
jgi:hypothetical protein